LEVRHLVTGLERELLKDGEALDARDRERLLSPELEGVDHVA
jgi:hypothetical protein